MVVLPKKNWVKFWLLLQSYRDIAWYVAGPHTLTRFVVRLELHQRGVRVATRCWLDSQIQCMFQASFSEICYTVTLADPGHGVIILESKVTATWKSCRNGRCHGNGYFCITNYLHPTSSGVVIRLQHYIHGCIFLTTASLDNGRQANWNTCQVKKVENVTGKYFITFTLSSSKKRNGNCELYLSMAE